MPENTLDGLKIGDIISLNTLTVENREIYNNSVTYKKTGNIAEDGSPEIEIVTRDNGNLGVIINDQTSDIVDYYVCISLFQLALSASAVVDSYAIIVVAGSSVANGTYFCI